MENSNPFYLNIFLYIFRLIKMIFSKVYHTVGPCYSSCEPEATAMKHSVIDLHSRPGTAAAQALAAIIEADA